MDQKENHGALFLFFKDIVNKVLVGSLSLWRDFHSLGRLRLVQRLRVVWGCLLSLTFTDVPSCFDRENSFSILSLLLGSSNMIGKKDKWEKPMTYQCMGASCLCFVVHGEGGIKLGYYWIFAKDINVIT